MHRSAETVKIQIIHSSVKTVGENRSAQLKSENPSTFWKENHFQFNMREWIKLSMPKQSAFFKTNQPLGGEAIPSNQAEGKVNFLTGHFVGLNSNM